MSERDHLERLRALGRRLIAEQMKGGNMVGAAFDGSLATGRAWDTSDLDFTVVPPSAAPPDPRRVPAYRFFYSQGPLARFHESVDLRVIDGVFVNMHVKTKEAIDQLVKDYPRSFIDSAATIPLDIEPTHYIDGLAIMGIVEDETGFLAKTKEFVAEHRFAREVLRGRLPTMYAWAERKLLESRRAFTEGTLEIGAMYDLARCIAQMWLEAHSRIYSKKEQDALLGEVAREANAPRVHELYRCIVGVDRPDEALRAVLTPIAEYAARVDTMFGFVEQMAAQHREKLGDDVVERCQAFRIWASLTLASVPIALAKGCHAHMAFALFGVGPASLNRFMQLLEQIAPSQRPSLEEACRAQMALSREVWEFFGYSDGPRGGSARQLDAASELLELTKRHILAER